MALELFHTIKSPASWDGVATGASDFKLSSGNLAVGGDLVIKKDMYLKSITWNRILSSTGWWRYVVLYNVTTGEFIDLTFLTSSGIDINYPGSKQQTSEFGTLWSWFYYGKPTQYPTLLKGNTYRISVMMLKDDTISDLSTPASVPAELSDYLEIGDGYKEPDLVAIGMPTISTGSQWYGDISLTFLQDTRQYIDPPWEPAVENTSGMFNIELPTELLPTSWTEWGLQYQTALDNSNFDAWKDLDTIQYPETTYSYSDLKVVDKPYYRFRYQLRTAGNRTNWSEAAVAGLAVDIVNAEDLEGQITGDQIASATITGGNISAGTITASLIAANSITTSHLQAGSVVASTIQSGTITATQIAAATITGNKIDANTITAGNIAAGTITATEIKSGTIVASLIAADSITSNEIKAGTITASDIASSTITATQIAANTITASNIKAATITGTEIAATTITAANIASGTITSVEIAGSTITGSNIAGSTITASKITISSLSSLSANIGTVTSGTVTGATLQTATSGTRVVIDSSGLTAYDASSNKILFFDTATGNLSLKGTISAGSTIPSTAITGTLTDAQLAAIAAAKITGTITATQIADDSITSAKIVAATIVSSDIAANTIIAGNIAAGTITTTEIKANTITASNIAASTITTTEIAANTIVAGDIAANTITAAQIATGTITATEIAASTITAAKLNVSQLSAITADMGSITAGTITGGTVQTASSGTRVVLNSTGLFASNGTDNTFQISSSDGSTSIASAAGVSTVTAPTIPNPSGTVDASGWTTSGGVITVSRTTTAGEFVSSPGGFKFSYTALTGASVIQKLGAGTLYAENTYILSIKIKKGTGTFNSSSAVIVSFGDNVSTGTLTLKSADLSTSVFTTLTVLWSPKLDSTDSQITIFANGSSGPLILFVDDLELREYAAPSTKQLAFIDSSLTKRASLYSYRSDTSSTNSKVALDSLPDVTTTEPSKSRLGLVQSNGELSGEVSVFYDPNAPGPAQAAVTAAAKNISQSSQRVTVVDGDGASDFMQVYTQSNFKQKVTDWGIGPWLAGDLPPTTQAGDHCYYYADAAKGIVWHLVHSGSGTYPWVKVGGPPLIEEIIDTESTSSTSYTTLTTDGPTINVPLAGDYLISIGAYIIAGSATLGAFRMSYKVGATAASDNDAVAGVQQSSLGLGSLARNGKRKTGLAASTSIVSNYKASAGTATFANRWMVVDPIRVG